ncbi:MAG: putative toxin-antitoxin system toxin component, PIN family [Candidatus Woesearchaeota archaeon]
MGKKKVVLDTNILISALGWNGKPRQIFQKCIEGDLELIISKEQLKELNKVMNYPKFKFSDEQKETFISIILEIAKVVEIKNSLKVIKDDPDDNMILETALASNVDYIISGDPHLLNLEEFKGIKILKASDFLDL